MSRTIALAAVVLALGATGAQAQTITMLGTDALFTMTQDILSICPNTSNITNVGGGSSSAESAMRATPPTQQIAPMSRFLSSAVCPASSTYPNAEGYAHSLDGISVVRRNSTKIGCDTMAYTTTMPVTTGSGDGTCPGCVSHAYTFNGYLDVLRVVFSGFTHDTVTNPAACTLSSPSRSAMTAKHCNSDVRNTLVNSWGNLFQNPSCGAGETNCPRLKHAFRPGDFSGTTDTFLTLLGMPSNPASASADGAFCNGRDQQDNDPIRRACTGNGRTSGEQVCQPREFSAMAYPANNTIPLGPPSDPWEPAVANTGDLGLVQDILVPEGVAVATSYSNNLCAFGNFELAQMPFADQLTNTRCPNGTPQVLLKCLYPRDASNNFGCNNFSANVPTIGELKRVDGRAYNKILRHGANPDDNIVADQLARQVVGAYYRLHSTTVETGGGIACREDNATRQIGCLVQASPCSVGFAGREATEDPTIGNNDVVGLMLGTPDSSMAVLPSAANVRKLLTDCAGGLGARYPLARTLWLNTLIGFSNTTGDQRNLANCFGDRFYVDQAALREGFLPLDDTACATPGLGGACQITSTKCIP